MRKKNVNFNKLFEYFLFISETKIINTNTGTKLMIHSCVNIIVISLKSPSIKRKRKKEKWGGVHSPYPSNLMQVKSDCLYHRMDSYTSDQ